MAKKEKSEINILKVDGRDLRNLKKKKRNTKDYLEKKLALFESCIHHMTWKMTGIKKKNTRFPRQRVFYVLKTMTPNNHLLIRNSFAFSGNFPGAGKSL